MNKNLNPYYFFLNIKRKLFPFYKNKEIKEVFKILEKNENPNTDVARFVGGCVRDFLQNKDIGDIDIATILTPKEVKNKFLNSKFKVIETGIEHGSVVIVKDKKNYEITTLRKDIKTFGRKAEVEFTKDWTEDSLRRDFSINSIYLNIKGQIFDPQNGVEDLSKNKVRFIGDAEKRLEEDYLRILRYIRFCIYYGSETNNDIIKKIRLKIDGVKNLSKERIFSELKKILLCKNFSNIFNNQDLLSIFKIIFPEFIYLDRFDNKSGKNYELKLKIETILSIMLIGEEHNHEYFFHKYNISNDLRIKLMNISKILKNFNQDSKFFKDNFEKNIYLFGKELMSNFTIFLSFDNKFTKNKLSNLLLKIKKTKIPEFHYTGDLLKKRGVREGKVMGIILKEIETSWLNNNFEISDTQVNEIIIKYN